MESVFFRSKVDPVPSSASSCPQRSTCSSSQLATNAVGIASERVQKCGRPISQFSTFADMRNGYTRPSSRKCDWPKILNRYAKLVLPQLHDILRGCEHYRACARSEYATNVMFHSQRDLSELYPRLLSHGTLCFGAQEVMNFLGRKLTGGFQGEVVSELSSLVCRRTGGSRIKHRVKQNWLKMYDKAGLVLRVETVINNPREFRVRKQVLRHCQKAMHRN